MKKHLTAVCLGIAAASLTLSFWSSTVMSQDAARRHMWEYTLRFAGPGLEGSTLNSAGGEGWEVVGSLNAPGGTQFYFKRLK